MQNATGAIILAAGNSRRMGQCKFLLPMSDGKSFFESVFETFQKQGVKKIVVVTQHKFVMVLEDLISKYDPKPLLIINEFPEYDRFYSLQLGIEALEKMKFVFVHNADSPFVDVKSLQILDKHKLKADYIYPSFNQRGGHPILIDKKTMRYLLSRPVTSILREELAHLTGLRIEVDNPFITVDIDTPEDYKTYFKQHLVQSY